MKSFKEFSENINGEYKLYSSLGDVPYGSYDSLNDAKWAAAIFKDMKLEKNLFYIEFTKGGENIRIYV